MEYHRRQTVISTSGRVKGEEKSNKILAREYQGKWLLWGYKSTWEVTNELNVNNMT
jgi:hypothetical protein